MLEIVFAIPSSMENGVVFPRASLKLAVVYTVRGEDGDVIREEGAVLAAVAKAVETFGGIDILVNNASAISLTDTEHTPMKRYDPMNDINARGTYLRTQACLP